MTDGETSLAAGGEGAGEGLDHCALFIGEIVGEGEGEGFGDDDELGEGAIHGGRCTEADVWAAVVASASAEDAATTGDLGLDGDACADGKVLDAGADFGDVAGDLMAEDHGLADGGGADASLFEVVDVGTADATRANADLDLAGARPRDIEVAKLQFSFFDDVESFHGAGYPFVS